MNAEPVVPDLPDLYAALQVHPQAEKEIIDAAYRKLAGKYHPDINKTPSADQKMKAINAAYELLSDPNRRAAYDRARARQAGRPFNPSERTWKGWQEINPSQVKWLPLILVVVSILAFRFSPGAALALLVCSVVLSLLLRLGGSRRG